MSFSLDYAQSAIYLFCRFCCLFVALWFLLQPVDMQLSLIDRLILVPVSVILQVVWSSFFHVFPNSGCLPRIRHFFPPIHRYVLSCYLTLLASGRGSGTQVNILTLIAHGLRRIGIESVRGIRGSRWGLLEWWLGLWCFHSYHIVLPAGIE